MVRKNLQGEASLPQLVLHCTAEVQWLMYFTAIVAYQIVLLPFITGFSVGILIAG